VTDDEAPHELIIAGPAARAIADELTEPVAAAVIEFVTGALLDQPTRVGKPLVRELEGIWSARRGTFRILYRIDEEHRAVIVLRVDHRRSAYRPR
jgi:mRNA interferase RelE/StbE